MSEKHMISLEEGKDTEKVDEKTDVEKVLLKPETPKPVVTEQKPVGVKVEPKPEPKVIVDSGVADEVRKIKEELDLLKKEREEAIRRKQEAEANKKKEEEEAMRKELDELRKSKDKYERASASPLNQGNGHISEERRSLISSFNEKLKALPERERIKVLDEAFAEYVVKREKDKATWGSGY